MNLINLDAYRQKAYLKRKSKSFREFDDYYEYCFLRNNEYDFPDYLSNSVQLNNINAVVMEKRAKMILYAVQFPKERFTLSQIVEWMQEYYIYLETKKELNTSIGDAEEIIQGVLYKGNPLILYKKGKKTLPYNPHNFIEITEEYTNLQTEVSPRRSKELNLDNQLKVVVNGKEVEGIPRLDFDLLTDLIISNGNLMVADYIDEYEGTIGFFSNEDPLIPVSFIIDQETTVYIQIEKQENGSFICFVEHGYLLSPDSI